MAGPRKDGHSRIAAAATWAGRAARCTTVEAARRPRLREVARRSIELHATVAATALRAAGLDEPAINPRAFVALFDGYGLHRIAGCDDHGLEDAVMALWAAATRAIGTR